MSFAGKSTSSSSSSSPSLTPFNSTIPGDLEPLSFLSRTDGRGQTSVEDEVWDSVHRLYVYVATCSRDDDSARITYFRRLLRLCSRYRATLLDNIAPLLGNEKASIEICATCHSREYSTDRSSSLSARTTGHCCWFRPDVRARGFLQGVLALCETPELFDNDVSEEDFRSLIVWA